MDSTDTIKEVQEKLRAGHLNANPQLCADYRARLAGEYSFWSGMLEDVLKTKPAFWNVKRKDFKSDAACDRFWEATPEGINETGITLKLRSIDKMMSALKTLIDIANNEARNNY